MHKQFTKQKISAHKLYVLGLSHSEILLNLETAFGKAVSSRTLSYWIKYFKGLDREHVSLDIPFELNQIGSHGLPWESGEYLCDMWFETIRNPVVTRQMISIDPNPDFAYTPTVREAKWWWRIHLLAKDDFNYSDVYLISVHYVDRELISLITDTSANYSDLDGYMTYKPWRDGIRGSEYMEAIKLGNLTNISKDEYTGSLIRPDVPTSIVKMWTQPISGEPYRYYTPSKALYLNYLISLGDNKEANQSQEFYSNIKLDHLHSIFSDQEINNVPIKAKEAINRIKWWQSQEQSMTNHD